VPKLRRARQVGHFIFVNGERASMRMTWPVGLRTASNLTKIPQITVQDFIELRAEEPNRIAVGAVENSLCIPLGSLKSRLAELDREKLLVVPCKGGYRSSIATNILRRAGFRDIANLTGGFDAWKAAGLAYVLPET
jgi:hydroxyacylglutathione hydrolase